jgi:glycerol-3-phosphate O-acyltransferase/dihydroxyacetone phosphate acyltransferase
VNPLYRTLHGTLRAAVKVFYGDIEVTGGEHLPATGPIIIACNHPNSIVDPLLLGTVTDRQIAFCARDGLFRIPLFGRLLRSVGAIPIRRRSDHGGASADNSDAFTAAGEVLARGGVMAIFPEGKTHGHLRIEPLKTGTARIAVAAETASHGLGARIVPVGITYLVRHAFRSDIHVAFGPPIDVAAAIGSTSDEATAVRGLTGQIGDALRDLAVHVEKTEDERLIAQVTAIVVGIRAGGGLDVGGQSPAERTALVRRVVDAYRWLSAAEPRRTAELRDRLERYMEEREALGLGGEKPALQHRSERRLPVRGAARIAVLVAAAPLALLGLVTSVVPHALLRLLMQPLRLSTDRVALFKLLAGAVIFGAAYAAEVVAVARLFGTLPAALFGLSLVPAGLFARRYLIETRLHRLQWRSLGVWRARDRLAALRGERQALVEALTELRVRYLDHIARGAAD